MDIKLHYIEKGSGEPLFLLHGNGESGEYFVNQIDFFSASRRVIAPDTRGHGKSPRGGGEFSLRHFADDLAGFMDEMNIDSADILGFSDGANIALLFALKYPARVKKLILNGANLYSRGVKPSTQIPVIIGYKLASFGAAKKPEVLPTAEMLGLMVNDPNLRPQELFAVTAHTLVIAGTRDMIKRKHTELIAACIPDSRLVFVKGDHFIAKKNPDEFNKAVAEFLNEWTMNNA